MAQLVKAPRLQRGNRGFKSLWVHTDFAESKINF